MSCVREDWVVFKKSTYCKVHIVSFKSDSTCPLYISKDIKDPIISDGNIKMQKVGPQVEQGVEQGVTLTNKAFSVATGQKYDDLLAKNVLEASKVSHAFRFTVLLNNPKNWADRRKILESKGLNVQLKAGIGRVFKTVFKGYKIWLGDQSIVVYFPSWRKYYVDEARFGFNFALADLKDFLDELAIACDSSFIIDGSYRFKVGGQHHALIYNSLARMYNREKKKLEVYDNKGELWLIIDNSRRESIKMEDLETVNKDSAVVDMDDIVSPFFNQLRDTKLMPNDILSMMQSVAEDRKYYAENIKSHVGSIQTLGSGVQELVAVVKELKDTFQNSKSTPAQRSEPTSNLDDQNSWSASLSNIFKKIWRR